MPEPLTMSPITSSLAALVSTQRFSSADGLFDDTINRLLAVLK